MRLSLSVGEALRDSDSLETLLKAYLPGGKLDLEAHSLKPCVCVCVCSGPDTGSG